MKETLWKINFICKGFTHDKCKTNDSFNCRFNKNYVELLLYKYV